MVQRRCHQRRLGALNLLRTVAIPVRHAESLDMRAASRPRRLPTDRTSDRVAHPRPSAMAGGPWYGHRRRANPGHLAAAQTALSKATPSAMRGTRVSIGPEYAWPSTTISALPAGPPRTSWHRWQFRRPSQGAAPRPQRRVAEYPGGYDGGVGSLTWPLRLFSVRLEILVECGRTAPLRRPVVQ